MQHSSSKTKIKTELLSPARNLASAKKAILCGADGIFIGGPSFGARVDAANQLEDLKKLCTFAHLFKVKVHVTLNTLLHDDEVIKAQELIDEYGRIGVDVLIVQDLSVFSLNIPKSIELHASTQCCIDSIEKLKFYEKLGVKQVVLPREFTLDKIKAFHEACPDLKLEAFVMGALCVGVSGICYLSEYLTGRSANRGCCAQICRLPMILKKDDKEVKRGHLLSLKDNCQEHNLKELLDAGVTSFKIEGRLKDENYVANATAYFREKLDLCLKENSNYQRQSVGNTSINFTPDLRKTFNRGFTDSLLLDKKDNLVHDKTPKFTGPYVGDVIRVSSDRKNTIIEVRKAKGVSFANGDGLTYFKKCLNKDSNIIADTLPSLDGFRVNSVLEDSKNKACLSLLSKVEIPLHTKLYRNTDVVFDSIFNKKDFATRFVDYTITLNIRNLLDNKYELELYAKADNDRDARVRFEYLYDETLNSLDENKLLTTLKKRVDVNTNAKDIVLNGDLKKLTIRLSILNDLRKNLLQKLFFEEIEKSTEYQSINTDITYPKSFIDARLVLNSKAKSLYEKCNCMVGYEDNAKGIFEKDSVMTCKYCLINEYGKCSKDGGNVSGYTLVIGNKSFNVKTDCKNCFMHLVKVTDR